jgi:hypothetical protein
MVIQRILRHAYVSTTATYYIKTAAADVRSAMMTLENRIAESPQTQTDTRVAPQIESERRHSYRSVVHSNHGQQVEDAVTYSQSLWFMYRMCTYGYL